MSQVGHKVVHGLFAGGGFYDDGIGVAADTGVPLEQRHLMPGRQAASRRQTGNSCTDDADFHAQRLASSVGTCHPPEGVGGSICSILLTK